MKHFKQFFTMLMLIAFNVGNVWAAWEKASSIAAGDVVLLVYETGKYELNGISTTSTKYGIGASYSSTPAGVYELTVEAGSEEGSFAFKNGTNYLTWTSGNSLNKATSKSNNTSWNVTFSSGDAIIANVADNTRKIRWNNNSGQYRFACYTSGQQAVQIYKQSGASSKCAMPTFNPVAGGVVSGTTVTISCATDGAAIHYTVDGTTPTASSPTYSSAITINEEKTIKAIAVKGGMDNSDVASASYTILEPKTIAQIMPTSETEGDAFLLNDVTVTYAYGNNVYVKDATGYMMVFSSIAGAANGKVLQGLQGKAKLYNGLPEVSTVTKAPTVTDGSAVAPEALTAYPTDADLNKYVTLEGVTFAAAATLSGTKNNVNGTYKGSTLIIRNNFLLSGISLETGKSYRIVGVVQKYNSDYQVYPISVEEIVEAGAPEAPTFSVAGGTYTSVQSVELSCATEGAVVYYTTNGDTPDNTSTLYSSPIEVGENMTIKAIAIKDEKESTVATAEYTINLPENEEVRKTWDLSVDETATASTTELTWTATYVSMSFAKGSGSTNANNYYPGTEGKSYTSTRAYTNGVITITPSGKQLTTVVFTATSASYASALAGSTWTNATAEADGSTVTVTATNGESAISAVVGGTCGFTAVQVNYTALDLTKPATPTFSVAAGTYTAVQTVEIECATAGATIYYTTDGTTPTDASTEYTAAITVDADMTIKAIAIKDTKSSSVAEAAYTINLPVSEEVQKTWDLTTDSYDADPTEDLIQWSATYVTMTNAKGSGTKVNNYIPTAQTSTRFYNGNTLTITPAGKQITSIVFTATSTSYANALEGSTWTNGAAVAEGTTVTVTVSAPGAVSADITGTCGCTAVQVNYGPIDASIPDAPTFTPAAGTYTAVQTVEIECATAGATIYYTTDGSTPDNTSTEYTGAITVDADMTIKAIAIKDTKSSAVASAAYTINLPVILTTMQAIYEKAAAVGSTATEVTIVFDNWVVSGVGTDEKTVYVTDGEKGFIIYGSEHGFVVNNKLNGSVTANLKLYGGSAELLNVKASDITTVTDDGVVTPVAANMADLGGVNTGAPVIVNNVQYNGTTLTDGVNTIKPYNSIYAFGEAFETDHYYNVTGIYVQYNTTKEIAPRSAADIQEVVLGDPELAYDPTSVEITVGEAFVPAVLTYATGFDGLAAVTYESNNTLVANVTPAGVVTLVEDAVGTATITATFAGNASYGPDNASYTIKVNAIAEPCDGSDDFDNEVSGETATSYKDRSTTNGWTATNAQWTTISEEKRYFTINGKTTAVGVITSPMLSDGIASLKIRYANMNSEANGVSFKVEIMKSGVAEKEYTITKENSAVTQGTVYTELIENINVEGEFQIVITNLCPSNNSSSNKDRVSIGKLCWANYSASTPTPDYTEVRNSLEIGRHYTICMPKNITEVRGGTFWSMSERNTAGDLAYLVEQAAPFDAGKPYIFKATAATLEVVYGDENAATPVDNGALRGTFDYMSSADLEAQGNVYLLISNTLVPIDHPTTNFLNANRAYVDYDALTAVSEPSHAPGRRVVAMPMHKDVTTGMDELNASETPVKVLINGQLYILRGEKMYNANGQLVK